MQGLLNVGELIWRQEELDPVPDLRERRRIAYFNEVGSEKPFKVEKTSALAAGGAVDMDGRKVYH